MGQRKVVVAEPDRDLAEDYACALEDRSEHIRAFPFKRLVPALDAYFEKEATAIVVHATWGGASGEISGTRACELLLEIDSGAKIFLSSGGWYSDYSHLIDQLKDKVCIVQKVGLSYFIDDLAGRILRIKEEGKKKDWAGMRIAWDGKKRELGLGMYGKEETFRLPGAPRIVERRAEEEVRQKNRLEPSGRIPSPLLPRKKG